MNTGLHMEMWLPDIIYALFSSCLSLFPPYFSHALSLCVHVNLSVNVVPGVLLVLNHNKNKYLSRDVLVHRVMSSCCLYCLYQSLHRPLPPFLPQLMCFHVLTPLSPPLWCLSDCSWKATAGLQADRAVWSSTEQTSVPRTWTMTTACANVPSCWLVVSTAKHSDQSDLL